MLLSAKVFAASCLLLAVFTHSCCSSAIPIWEFLTRNEKMSYLYSTFAQLVSVHCKTSTITSATPVNQCKHGLLSYGYEKLQTFSDRQLEALDPYQRGSSELIWSSIMSDHPSVRLITTQKALPAPLLTAERTAIQPTTSHATIVTKSDDRQDLPNPIFEINAEQKHQYAMDMDMAYGYPINYRVQLQQPQHQPELVSYNEGNVPKQNYLTGPVVFRVRPDGTPVEEDRLRTLPGDDDLEENQAALKNDNTNNNNKNNDYIRHSHNFKNKPQRRIATITALKKDELATLVLQQQQQRHQLRLHHRRSAKI